MHEMRKIRRADTNVWAMAAEENNEDPLLVSFIDENRGRGVFANKNFLKFELICKDKYFLKFVPKSQSKTPLSGYLLSRLDYRPVHVVVVPQWASSFVLT